MKILFWGTRGSLPYSVRPEAVRKKIKMALQLAVEKKLHNEADIDHFIDTQLSFDIMASYGCNTPCVELSGGNEFVICDAGTGLRDFGNQLQQRKQTGSQTFNIFMSHLHWDHIQGFPFFTPAFTPGHRINIYGCHKQLETSFIQQQQAPFFPLPLAQMAADIHFHVLDADKVYDIAGFEITIGKQAHPGDSYSYAFLDFARGADVLIYDAQYNLVDHFFNKRSWGHSSNIVAVELAVRSEVKHLCLFHNEHTLDDHQLEKFLEDTSHYLQLYAQGNGLSIDLAYDGLEISL